LLFNIIIYHNLLERVICEMDKKLKSDVLTIEQTAEYLKVSPSTVYNLVSEEKISGKIFAKKVGVQWRIKLEELDRFLSEEKGNLHQVSFKKLKSNKKNN